MAMFENFPYTDMHNLNLDWIIKIAKDFLDQYTHIQQLISDGEESLQNLTTEGLQQLQDKADALEAALNAWYNEHSEDIANQLAESLQDMYEWYSEHMTLMDTALTNAITAFNAAAEQKAAQTIESIPDDYTALSNEVLDIHTGSTRGNNLIGSMYPITEGKYIANNGNENTLNILAHTDYIDLCGATTLYGHFSNNSVGQNNIGVYYDDNKNFIDSIYGTTIAFTAGGDWIAVVPPTAKYVRLNRLMTGDYTEGNFAVASDTYKYLNNANYEDERNIFGKTYRQIDGVYYNNSGVMTSLSILACTPYIEIGNRNIIEGKFNYNGSPQTHRGCYYDKNKTFIAPISNSVVTFPDGSYKSLIPKDAKYVIINHTSSADTTEGNYAYIKHETDPNYLLSKISFLGDSITYGYGLQTEEKFVTILEKRFGVSINNQSVSGSEISTADGLADSFVKRVENITACDICFVFGGTNDYWHGNVEINGNSNDTLEGGLKAVLTYLYETVGVHQVVVVTPFKQYFQSHYGIGYDKGHGTLTDFVNKIIDVAKYFGADVIDLFNGNNIEAIPETPVRTARLLQDGVHPTAIGNYVLANIFTEYIKSHLYPKETSV